jgi:N-acetylglucosamine-6-phosphate deacetylase
MSKGVVLRGARVVTPYRDIARGYVSIVEGRIAEVGEEPYRNREGLDEVLLEGFTVGPGFVDTHMHGALGVDLSAAGVSDVELLSRKLPMFGVTSFVPTSYTLPRDLLVSFCRNIYAASKSPAGARIVGIHLEGPYINPEKAGAQNPSYARPASTEELEELIAASGGLLRSVTLAPEIPGGLDLVRYATSRGIVVQVGHTNASYSKTVEAITVGASKATHLYNAMSGFHHRSPGAALALLRSDSVYLEIIADFIHVAPEVVDFTISYATHRRIVLVTDSIAATGMPDGTYRLGEVEVEVSGGVARVAGQGVLAGSTLTMDRALANVISLGYSVREALYMTSTAPAMSLGLSSEVGSLLPGRRADLVVLDGKLKVAATVIGGEVAYVRDEYRDSVSW